MTFTNSKAQKRACNYGISPILTPFEAAVAMQNPNQQPQDSYISILELGITVASGPASVSLENLTFLHQQTPPVTRAVPVGERHLDLFVLQRLLLGLPLQSQFLRTKQFSSLTLTNISSSAGDAVAQWKRVGLTTPLTRVRIPGKNTKYRLLNPHCTLQTW